MRLPVWIISIAIALAMLPLAGAALGATLVEDVRTWDGPSHTRVVFDLSRAPDHRLFTLTDPHRAVIDLHGGRISADQVEGIRDEGPIRRVRSGRRDQGVRIVLDLDRAVAAESFTMTPNDTGGHRLVVDLSDPQPNTAVRRAPDQAAEPFVVAIDAGHGGKDPGAIGAAGTYEKGIVLSVARKLADRIDAIQGLESVLIRDGDYYIGLRERTRKAQAAGADLFVSLHADAFHDRRVRGSSVFVLSRNGATSEMARMLARRENRADRIGGVSLADKDEQVASVLVDLSRAHTVEESLDVADVLFNKLDTLGDVHGTGVEQAGFAVLKSLDMPSVLVELAFISNPEEERRLKSSSYQHQLARGLTEGVRAYVEQTRPALALSGGDEEYRVRPGDTLSDIAQRHAVSVSELRRANELAGSTIVAGHTLRIP
ncbi:N-acetylmuramoyl-L-alanine amidase [Spiribacter roseus]|uniref:N-acetylmuramoyl-L-alanine amidase n=1 Tax=Spiribacter TaxID=1335745 RepID=UPI0016428474|nr:MULTISPECIES: N-acetylmuramoyl-L-alanine amidase [Spiribacter]KAF0279951.1 N-acetylmuramoyl-L-alanine amidase [Spiribacter roseus]